MKKVHKNTQLGRLLETLKRKKGISSLEAFQELGITSLHRRLSDLREMGYEIGDQWHYKTDADGKVITRWKVYWLVA